MFAAWFSASDWRRKIPASIVDEVVKLSWLAVLLTFSKFYLNIYVCVYVRCVFVNREKFWQKAYNQ